jgi:acylpyruvate hydrolase
MRLATIRTATGNRAVRVDADAAVETGEADVRALLERPDWAEHAAAAAGPSHELATLDYAPLVPSPEKIICVGLNYRDHVEEMGNQLPEYPTVFAKYAPSLVGAYDDIILPRASTAIDYEVELTVVIGRSVRHATPEEAQAAIAGYTVLNDVSVRDFQYRTKQFLQGKTWERTTPLGPWLTSCPRAAGMCRPCSTARRCSTRPPRSSCSRRSTWSSTCPRSSRSTRAT